MQFTLAHPTVTLIHCIKPGEILQTDNIYIIYIDISIVWVYIIGDKGIISHQLRQLEPVVQELTGTFMENKGIIRLQPRQSEPVVKDLIDALVFLILRVQRKRRPSVQREIATRQIPTSTGGRRPQGDRQPSILRLYSIYRKTACPRGAGAPCRRRAGARAAG